MCHLGSRDKAENKTDWVPVFMQFTLVEMRKKKNKVGKRIDGEVRGKLF